MDSRCSGKRTEVKIDVVHYMFRILASLLVSFTVRFVAVEQFFTEHGEAYGRQVCLRD